MTSIVFAAIILLFTLLAYHNFYYKRRKWPPGPTPLPFLGNLLTISNAGANNCLFQWAKKYGDVYTVWFGEEPVVMLASSHRIADVIQRQGVVDKYAQPGFHQIFGAGGRLGIMRVNGDLWRDHRRFALHVFRDFGVGKNVMEQKILAEIVDRFSNLSENVEIDMGEKFDLGVGSIFNDLLIGYRFDKKNEWQFAVRKQQVGHWMKQLTRWDVNLILGHYSFFSQLPYFASVANDMTQLTTDILDFFRRHVEEHAEKINLSDLEAPSNDFVEAYLKEAERRRLAGEVNHSYTMHQLLCTLFDLWIAGQETTSLTLTWGVAHLLHAPDIQRRIRDELDTVIGDPNRLITINERARLPYLCAVINEIQRLSNIVLSNFIYKTAEEIEANQYRLPAGSLIIPQISASLYDSDQFVNPFSFDPNRFLTDNGQLKKCESFFPFGVGRRQCLGEPLARMELFLFFANLINQYEITVGSQGLPSLKRDTGVTVPCSKFGCRVRLRS